MNDDGPDPTGYYARKEKRHAEGCLPAIGWLALICFLGFISYGLMIAFGPRM